MILLHADGAIAFPFFGAWSFSPFLTIGLLIAAVGYLLGLRQISRRYQSSWPGWHTAAFYGGLAATAIALLGPLDTYNDELFLLHMTQHLTLILVAAPLILIGRPVQLALRSISPHHIKSVTRATLTSPLVRQVLTVLTMPIVVILVFNSNLALWHMPTLYQAALSNNWIHLLMHTAFFTTALYFWWPIIDPVPRHHKFHVVETLVAIGVAAFVGKIVGGILAFSDTAIYPFYEDAERPWSLSALTDQQLGGTIMLMVGGLTYASIFLLILARTLLASEQSEQQYAARPHYRHQW